VQYILYVKNFETPFTEVNVFRMNTYFAGIFISMNWWWSISIKSHIIQNSVTKKIRKDQKILCDRVPYLIKKKSREPFKVIKKTILNLTSSGPCEKLFPRPSEVFRLSCTKNISMIIISRYYVLHYFR